MTTSIPLSFFSIVAACCSLTETKPHNFLSPVSITKEAKLDYTDWNTNWLAFKAIIHSLSDPEICTAMAKYSDSISGSKDCKESLELTLPLSFFFSSFCWLFFFCYCCSFFVFSTFMKGCLLVFRHDNWDMTCFPVEIFF